jgi:phosphatidylinositol 4-kinase
MLLQRLRGVDIVTESAIVTNLIPLTLAGSNADLVEVYRALSQISRSSHPEDPRTSSNAVLAAQTTLAKGLGSRLVDTAEGYLTELLTLFADKGTQTQIVTMSADVRDRDRGKLANLRADSLKRVEDMKAGLAALLIPISELLSHNDYNPQLSPSAECVALFRNLWLLCVVFGLSGKAGRNQLSDHEASALAIIAKKTPPLVLENATDFVGGELEYNTVLRKDFAVSIHSKMRQQVTDVLPSQSFVSDIRNMTTPQLTFVAAIHDLEQSRTLSSHPSGMLQYFANDSINKCVPLVGCLTGVANKLSNVFLKDLSRQAVDHNMPDAVSEEVRKILVACTHRMRKVREVALSYARQVIETFSALMCDRKVVFTLLEILTLLRRACEMQFTDEVSEGFLLF